MVEIPEQKKLEISLLGDCKVVLFMIFSICLSVV